LNISHKQKVQQ